MAEFNSALFEALATGPGITTRSGRRWEWTAEQAKALQETKDQLFEIVMLYAAQNMINNEQDDKELEHDREARVLLGITFSSSGAYREVNGFPANHQPPAGPLSTDEGPAALLDTSISIATDFGIVFDSSPDQNPEIEAAQEAFIRRGKICPFFIDLC